MGDRAFQPFSESQHKVSVIMPVYNAERYIADAINSVLAQTYSNFELLIVDDGSSDQSLTICQQFTDPRIYILWQENRGPSAARNAGIRHATGKYIAFLDADDLWLPQKLEKHIAHFHHFPEVGVSFSRSAFIDSNGKPLNYHQMPCLDSITTPHLLCRNPIGNGSVPVIARDVLAEICYSDNLYGEVEDFYFDDRLLRSEDIECWLRIAIQTQWQIAGIPDVLTLYRVSSEKNSLSSSVLKHLEDFEKMIDKTSSYAPELIAEWGNLARAYQLRYLARRAVRSRDKKMAIVLINRALQTDWKILLAEPRRTLITITAAYCLRFLPTTFYRQIETLGLKLTGIFQKFRIRQDLTRSKAPNLL